MGLNIPGVFFLNLSFAHRKAENPEPAPSYQRLLSSENKIGHERLAMKDSFIRTTKAMDGMDKHRNTAGQNG